MYPPHVTLLLPRPESINYLFERCPRPRNTARAEASYLPNNHGSGDGEASLVRHTGLVPPSPRPVLPTSWEIADGVPVHQQVTTPVTTAWERTIAPATNKKPTTRVTRCWVQDSGMMELLR